MGRFRYFILPMLAIIPLAALALMLLWNWLAPDLFTLGTITFWQSLGLLVLLRLLIGPRFGFWFYRPHWYGHHRHRHFWKQKMLEKWDNLSDEEKEQYRQKFRHRHCFPIDYNQQSSEPEPKAT